MFNINASKNWRYNMLRSYKRPKSNVKKHLGDPVSGDTFCNFMPYSNS